MNKNAGVKFPRQKAWFTISSLLLIVTLALPGCGSKVPTRPDILQKATGHNRKGIMAENQGKIQLSVDEFNRAYVLYASVEDTDGMLVTLINLSRIARRQGDLAQAQTSLNKAAVLNTEDPSLITEHAFEQALLFLAHGEIEEAHLWAMKSLDSSSKRTKGSRLNLLARILYLKGDAVEAMNKAQLALNALQSHQLVEQANANRLLGDLATEEEQFEVASSYYQKALDADKKAAFSARIAQDLQRLAKVSLLSNSPQNAIDYLNRALLVSVNGRDLVTAASIFDAMVEAYRSFGNVKMASQLEQRRTELLQIPKK